MAGTLGSLTQSLALSAMKNQPLSVFLFVAFLHTSLSQLPPELKSCSKSLPDYNKCIESQIEKAVVLFKNGYKKFGILPLEPLRFNTIFIDQGTGPVAIKLEFRNASFHGLSKLKVHSSKNDWSKLEYSIYLDQLKLKSNYKIGGKVLILPIQGDGPCEIIFNKLTIFMKLDFKNKNKEGKKYFEVTNFHIELNPKNVIFKFENLFNGDKALGDNMNKFLNENWLEILNELRPAISKAMSIGFTQISNKVFSKIPADIIDIK